MPKVYLTEQDRLRARIARWIYGEMRLRRVSQRKLSEKMGISHQALSQKLRKQSFDITDFDFFIHEFRPSQKELLQIIGYEEGS